jgi:hypothetical protein
MIDITTIESYYTLSQKNAAELVVDNGITELKFRKFNGDTGEEKIDGALFIPVSIEELNGMKIDYQSKIDMIDNFITEINNL